MRRAELWEVDAKIGALLDLAANMRDRPDHNPAQLNAVLGQVMDCYRLKSRLKNRKAPKPKAKVERDPFERKPGERVADWEERVGVPADLRGLPLSSTWVEAGLRRPSPVGRLPALHDVPLDGAWQVQGDLYGRLVDGAWKAPRLTPTPDLQLNRQRRRDRERT